ncbi:hypothetical protein Bca4012_102682 [Brassica carinata]
MAHLELSIPWDGSTKQPPRPTYLKFENRSRTLRPDASNHWLYPIELASELQLSRGKLRGNQLLDGSISLSPLYPSQTNDLHARSPWPPPEFLWLRPPGIVHHLSVPTGMLTLNPSRKIKVGRLCTREGSSQSASLRHGFTSPADSHTCQTLGPCFKTGRMGSPQADARARRCRGTPLDGIYRPIGAAFPNNPTQTAPWCDRVRTTGSHLSGALSRELGPGPPLRTLPDYTNAKTPDFQAGLFPFAATKGILDFGSSRAFDQTIDDLTRIEFTTACQDALASLARFWPTARGNTRRPASVRYPREDWGRRFVTPSRRASPKAWGATCAQRLDGSRILQFTPSIDFATLFIDASRDIRCRVALDFTLQHRFQQTPPPVGESRLQAYDYWQDQPGSIHKSRQALVMFPQTHGKREQTKTWPPSLSETNVLSRTEFLRVTAIIFPQPRSQQTACSPWRTMHKLCKDTLIAPLTSIFPTTRDVIKRAAGRRMKPGQDHTSENLILGAKWSTEKSPKSRRKVTETVPPSDLNLSIIVLHQALGHYPHPFDSHSPGLSVGDFGLRGLSASTHISTLTLPVDCPVIFATRIVRQYAYQHAGPSRGLSAGDIRHEDCPRVIFATRTVRQYTYQHAGPSRGLSGLSVGDFRHEDCPRVIFATRTVRQHAYQHAGPSRGLSGDFRHDDYPPVCISARWPFPRTIRGRYSPRGLSAGDFRHEDCPPARISARWPFPLTVRTHISTLALPVDYPWRYSPRGLSAVIFATRTVRQYAYQHAGPSRGLSAVIFATRTVRVGDFRHEDCPRVIFATRTVRQDAYQHAGPSRGLSGDFRHEDCPPVRISARWPFPWTIRGDFRHEDCPRDCPRVIFATRTVRQHAYQHAGPSRGLSGDFRHEDCPPVRISARWPFPWTIRGDFRHEDCPRVIFATRTVRGDFRHEDCPPVRISARWPFPWTIRGDFRHEECPWVIFATRTVRLSASTHNSTLTLPVDCPVLLPRGQYISTHIGTLALPVDCSVIFATRTVRQRQLCTDGKSTWTVWVIFAHEDCPLVHISASLALPVDWSAIGGGRCAASSPDSDLEALSHNPAHGSFATGFSTKRDDQLCESTVPLASVGLESSSTGSSFPADSAKPALLAVVSLDSRQDSGNLSDSPCPHFSSELAVRRPGKLPKSRSQSAPADTRRSARHVSAQAARQQSTGSNWDPEPSPQSQSFSRLRIHFADFLAYIVPSTRGCSPWRPDAL